MNSGNIIFLHGASSSGKSTLAKILQQEIDEPFWHIEKYWSGGEPDWQEVEEVSRELNKLGKKAVSNKLLLLCNITVANTCQGNHQLAHQNLEAAKQVKDESSPFFDHINISWATAILAATEGRWQESVKAFKDLTDIFSLKGYRWEHAHTLCDWGDALVSRSEAKDFKAARDLYNQAIEIYNDLEATWYLEQVEKRLERITQ